MVEQTKSINLDLKRTIPVFSDSVLVANVIKNRPAEQKKNSKKKENPEGFVTLIFVDSVAQQPVARIVLPKSTAENLETALKTNLENFGKEVKPDISKDKKPERKNYLG
jgi:hypothetical protein